MAINQPKITDDQVENSWKLEVTSQVNNEEARINALTSRVETVEARSVMNATNVGTLRQDDFLVRITDGAQTVYPFTMLSGNIPETHMVFLGGFRLCESTAVTPRDYSISGNTITLTRGSEHFVGLDLILTVFTLA